MAETPSRASVTMLPSRSVLSLFLPAFQFTHSLSQRINILRSQGFAPGTIPELLQWLKLVATCQKVFIANAHPAAAASAYSLSSLLTLFLTCLTSHHRPCPTERPHINGFPPQPNGIASPHPLSAGSIPAQSHPPSPQSPDFFTPDQLFPFKNQIAAFKALANGVPIPEPLRNALLPQNQASAINSLEKALQAPTSLHASSTSTPPLSSTAPLPPPTRQSKAA